MGVGHQRQCLVVRCFNARGRAQHAHGDGRAAIIVAFLEGLCENGVADLSCQLRCGRVLQSGGRRADGASSSGTRTGADAWRLQVTSRAITSPSLHASVRTETPLPSIVARPLLQDSRCFMLGLKAVGADVEVDEGAAAAVIRVALRKARGVLVVAEHVDAIDLHVECVRVGPQQCAHTAVADGDAGLAARHRAIEHEVRVGDQLRERHIENAAAADRRRCRIASLGATSCKP